VCIKGPHDAAYFRRILLATDFSQESLAAAPCALSLAQENEAKLTLLYVVRDTHKENGRNAGVITNLSFQLHEIVPRDAESWCGPEAIVTYSGPVQEVLEAARKSDADLIVLGVRDAAGRMGAATHLERAVAHEAVARAACPVLTVRY
jgi:nucleotide-binding universal stress UspA family protein